MGRGRWALPPAEGKGRGAVSGGRPIGAAGCRQPGVMPPPPPPGARSSRVGTARAQATMVKSAPLGEGKIGLRAGGGGGSWEPPEGGGGGLAMGLL